MKVTCRTIKNTKQIDKPNEDMLLCDDLNNIYIVLDGVSRDNENGLYPNPSPAIEVVNIIAHTIYESMCTLSTNHKNVLDNICLSIQKSNEKVRLYNDNAKLSFAAGAVGIVIKIIDNELYYAYIGDCSGRAIYKDKCHIFTTSQTELIVKHKKEYSTYEIREVICNNPEHPHSYGVINGDSRAIKFVKTGKIDLTDVEHIILSSDGMEEYLLNCSLNILSKSNADELIEGAIEFAQKNQDDRTIIKIERDV